MTSGPRSLPHTHPRLSQQAGPVYYATVATFLHTHERIVTTRARPTLGRRPAVGAATLNLSASAPTDIRAPTTAGRDRPGKEHGSRRQSLGVTHLSAEVARVPGATFNGCVFPSAGEYEVRSHVVADGKGAQR